MYSNLAADTVTASLKYIFKYSEKHCKFMNNWYLNSAMDIKSTHLVSCNWLFVMAHASVNITGNPREHERKNIIIIW